MKNQLTIFSNEAFGQIRAMTIDHEPWFVGKDIAEALGYAKARNAIAEHVAEDDARKQGVTDTMGRIQETTIINESGVYALIFGSKLETAKAFKHWVTSEVLPSIRKTGSYTTDSAKQARSDAMLRNSRARAASLWLKLADRVDIPEYKQICNSYAAGELAGREVIPLPASEQRHYTATEIGNMLGGVDKTVIGKIANANGLKTEEYGKWFHDKSPYSAKEVDTFRYNDKAVSRFREILGIDEVGA